MSSKGEGERGRVTWRWLLTLEFDEANHDIFDMVINIIYIYIIHSIYIYKYGLSVYKVKYIKK